MSKKIVMEDLLRIKLRMIHLAIEHIETIPEDMLSKIVEEKGMYVIQMSIESLTKNVN